MANKKPFKYGRLATNSDIKRSVQSHVFSSNISISRYRAKPAERFAQLMNILISHCVNSEESCHYLANNHAALAEAADISVASVFNYFPTRSVLDDSVVWWAEANMDNEDDAAREAAEIIIAQHVANNRLYAADHGYTLQLVKN